MEDSFRPSSSPPSSPSLSSASSAWTATGFDAALGHNGIDFPSELNLGNVKLELDSQIYSPSPHTFESESKNGMAVGQEGNPYKGLQVRILGIPPTGAKSRVETQIKLCVQLVTANGEKANRWDYLHLPEHLVQKDKLRQSARLDLLPNKKTLTLEASVVCASDPTRAVTTCFGCIQRERKRSQRRKEQQSQRAVASSPPSGPPSPTTQISDNQLVPDKTYDNVQLDQLRILVFNCNSVVDFSNGDTILPTRITCYCRHHNEKTGFCIYFVMRDTNNEIVAMGMSPPIMITDDHKSAKARSNKRLRSDSLVSSMPTAPVTTDIDMLSEILDDDDLSVLEDMSSLSKSPSLLIPKEEPLDTSVGSPSPPQVMPIPQISRLIPAEGPQHGGIEVTILGNNFYEGLVVLFGGAQAIPTHCWSTTTLVCVLPPAATPGPVPVTIQAPPHILHTGDDQEPPLFTYRDESDRALMELALQLVGMKLTGKLEDARSIALAIVNMNHGDPGDSNLMLAGSSEEHGQNMMKLETTILTALSRIASFDLDGPRELDLVRQQTQQTLLHYAAMKGMYRLAEFLVSHGADVQVADRYLMTPLHYACLHGHLSIAQLLLETGDADPWATNAAGKSVLALASKAMVRTLWPIVKSLIEERSLVDLDEDMEADQQARRLSKPGSETDATAAADKTAKPRQTFAMTPFLKAPLKQMPVIMNNTAAIMMNNTAAFFQPIPTFFKDHIFNTISPSSSASATPSGGDAQNVIRVEKQRRRKRDRMIFNFWLPLFLVVAALALVQYMSTDQVSDFASFSFRGFGIAT